MFINQNKCHRFS